MSTFYDAFMNFPVEERRRIATQSGLSLAYVQKHMYVSHRNPKFHFANAVLLDEHSNGVLPFIQYTEGNIDWDFVRRRLVAAARRGELS